MEYSNWKFTKNARELGESAMVSVENLHIATVSWQSIFYYAQRLKQECIIETIVRFLIVSSSINMD